MNLMIKIYITVCVVLLMFDIVFLIVKNVRNHRFYPKNAKFEDKLIEEIEKRKSTGSFSEGFYDVLVKQISRTKNLIVLQGIMEKYPESKSWFKPAVISCYDNFKKKPDYEQAYYTYIVSILGYENEKVPAEFASDFLNFLDSKSLYTFANTMNAIYEFGEENLLLTAIDKTDERQGFYHKKLLVDGLLTAKVDKVHFGEKLVERFYRYDNYTKDCILSYFRLAGIQVPEFCMKLMKSEEENKEIRYAAMRYFAKYPNEEAKEYFEDILRKDGDEWLLQMLAIQGLGRYSDEETRNLIKSKITSYNWYVRVNAANYLHENGLNKEEIYEILSLKDRYTNETLLYQYRNDEVMSDYIVDAIAKIQAGGDV